MHEQKKSAGNMIKEALVSLMGEKTYMDITVTDIVKKAGVARASFYRNYQSIADIMDDIVDDIFSEIMTEVLPVIESNDEAKWRELLYYMFYRFPKHHSIGSEKRSDNINELFSRMDDRFQKLEQTSGITSIEDKYLGIGKMGLIVNIIKKWMNTGMKEPCEQMVEFIMSFILKF